MVYEIKVSAQVAASMRGTRHRAGLTFSRLPVYLEALPKEVEDDPHLYVRELKSLPTGEHLTPLPGQELKPERVQMKPPDERQAGSPVSGIKGIGPATEKLLAKRGWGTLGELAAADPEAVLVLEGLQAGAIVTLRDWLAGAEAAALREPPADDDPVANLGNTNPAPKLAGAAAAGDDPPTAPLKPERVQ